MENLLFQKVSPLIFDKFGWRFYAFPQCTMTFPYLNCLHWCPRSFYQAMRVIVYLYICISISIYSWLNIIDIFCLHIFLLMFNQNTNYGRFINQFPPNIIRSIWQFESINKKICWQKMSIMFSQICINEEMLPKYTSLSLSLSLSLYIYIYIYTKVIQ